MDREGVDVSVLFPTLGLYIMWRNNLDPELSAAICLPTTPGSPIIVATTLNVSTVSHSFRCRIRNGPWQS